MHEEVKKKKPRHSYQDFKLRKKIVYLLKSHFQLCNLAPSLEGSDINGSQIDTAGFLQALKLLLLLLFSVVNKIPYF